MNNHSEARRLDDEQGRADSFDAFYMALTTEAAQYGIDAKVAQALTTALLEPHAWLWSRLEAERRQADAYAEAAARVAPPRQWPTTSTPRRMRVKHRCTYLGMRVRTAWWILCGATDIMVCHTPYGQGYSVTAWWGGLSEHFFGEKA